MQYRVAMKIKLGLICFLICISTVFVNAYADSPSIASPFAQPKAVDKSISLDMIPSPPDLGVKSFILMDANSGYIIAEKNSHSKLPPASLTKIMTLYLAAHALRDGKMNFDDQVVVSEKAWRTGGSRMFIKAGSSVSIKDLIKGSAIASGNDATIALAEHMAGDESAFVELMNQTARALQMNDTSYADSSGLPNDNNYSTAYDLAFLAKAWIKDFPEYYPWFKEKWNSYGGIKQPNRNRLLWHDPSVDGMKTGLTDEAGYCLIASALRDNTRLIAVIVGAKSDALRTSQSKALLNYGFRFFETHKLFGANTKISAPKVLFGKKSTTDLGLLEPLYVTSPAGQYKKLKAKAEINANLKAPVEKDKVCGVLNIMLDDKVMSSRPLVALQDNPKANFIFRIFDYIRMIF